MRRFELVSLAFLVVAITSVLTEGSFQAAVLGLGVFEPQPAAVQSVSSGSTTAPLVGIAAPRAHAGSDQTVAPGARVLLDGSHSSNSNESPLTFAWSFVSMPAGSTAVLDNPALVSPTFVVDRSGDYAVQLVVSDGSISSTANTVIISTVNSRPVANAGANQTVTVGADVLLNGSGSSDVDGDPVRFSWSFVSVPAGSGPALINPSALVPSFRANVPGEYVVQLIANDGRSDSLPSTLVISTRNSAPVAKVGPAPRTSVGQRVWLDGSGSSDIDGDPLTLRWSLISRPQNSATTLSDSNTVHPSFDADTPGIYVVQLVVHDGRGNSSADTVRITTGNTRPVANAGPNETVRIRSSSPIEDDGGTADSVSVLQLDGSQSSDVDGDLLTFAWSFVSRPAGSTAALSNAQAVKPTFIPDAAGSYVAQLIVNDGATDSPPVTVVITTKSFAPVAKAGRDQTTFVGSTVQLDGTGAFDTDGDYLIFSWALIAKPASSTTAVINPNSARPLLVADVAGTYVVQLTVNDGRQNSAPDTITISTVNSRPVAAAGRNQFVLPGKTVHLDGSTSTDADYDPLTYRWSITARPAGSAALLSYSDTESSMLVADVPGVYVAQLIVNDGTVDSIPETVTINTSAEVALAPNGGVSNSAVIASVDYVSDCQITSTPSVGSPVTAFQSNHVTTGENFTGSASCTTMSNFGISGAASSTTNTSSVSDSLITSSGTSHEEEGSGSGVSHSGSALSRLIVTLTPAVDTSYNFEIAQIVNGSDAFSGSFIRLRDTAAATNLYQLNSSGVAGNATGLLQAGISYELRGSTLTNFVTTSTGQSLDTSYALRLVLQPISNPAALRFIPVTPCRIMDTRPGSGFTGPFGAPFIPANTTRTVPIPSSVCGIPSTAKAYSLNTTVVPHGFLGYLTLWPTGVSQPFVSTLNAYDGRVTANAAIVPAGTSGSINAYAANDTDLILDINGYFLDTTISTALVFYPVTPCRVLDTRTPNGTFGGPILGGGSTRSFPVPSSSCGIPTTAQAYTLNATVVPSAFLDYLTLWPTGVPQPLVSTLNSYDGQVTANMAIVPAGTGGAINAFATQNTHLVLDITGYFAPPGPGGLHLFTLTPCRVVDTRNSNGPLGGPLLSGGTSRSFPVPSGGCNVPASAQAYSMNATVVPSGFLNYLTVWPTGIGQPFVSTLNAGDGQVTANALIVPAGTGGAVSAFVTETTHMILDISGYFAP